MRVPVTDFIDPDVAGTSPELRPRAADLASFTAGYLGRLIRTPEFQSTERVVREKVRHLSFLVHLVCRLDDFEAVYREFLSVEEVLTCGNIGWDNEGYFRDWERKTLQKVNLGFFGGKTVRDVIIEMTYIVESCQILVELHKSPSNQPANRHQLCWSSESD